MVKNLPSNAGDVGSVPGQGTEVPHVSEQLSLSTITTEPKHPGACVPPLESPCAATKTPRDAGKIPHAAARTALSQTDKET